MGVKGACRLLRNLLETLSVGRPREEGSLYAIGAISSVVLTPGEKDLLEAHHLRPVTALGLGLEARFTSSDRRQRHGLRVRRPI